MNSPAPQKRLTTKLDILNYLSEKGQTRVQAQQLKASLEGLSFWEIKKVLKEHADSIRYNSKDILDVIVVNLLKHIA